MTTVRTTPRGPESIRTAIEVVPARPALAAGLRAALATVLPLVLGQILGRPELLWVSLAGFNAALADKGGSYRGRAVAMGTLTVAAALSGVVASEAGSVAWLAPILMVVWGTATSLARVYGDAWASVGLSIASTFLIALALPAHGDAALARGLLLLIGGAWAMLLSLALWTVRPYRPARLAVARCYRELAAFASLVARPGTEALAETHADRARIRDALESARVVLAGTRRGRPGESGRGERLLVLLEAADRQFGVVLALGDVMESELRDGAHDRALRLLRVTLGEYAELAMRLADLLEAERGGIVPPVPLWSARAVRDAAASSDVERARHAHAAHLVARLGELAFVASGAAATLGDERPARAGIALPPAVASASATSWLHPLRDALAPGSLALRHALRVGIVMGAAVLLARALRLPHGYWLTLTVLVVLQPFAGATLVKGMQRIAGTVLGGLFAALVGAAVHDTRAVLVLVAILTVATVALLPINYGLYVFFLTPTFVLLTEAIEADWHLVSARIENTVLGGVLALVATRLLWPSPERERFPAQLAAALRAARDYLRHALAARAGPTPNALRALGEARRSLGLAVSNGEASLQRLITELPARDPVVEPAMVSMTYARRLGASITAIAAGAAAGTAAEHPAWMDAIGDALGRALGALADAAESGSPPPPMPEPEPAVDGAAQWAGRDESALFLRAQIDRITEQVSVLAAAVGRIATRDAARAPGGAGAAPLAPRPEAG